MCGIVGMAGGLTYSDEQRFKLMLLLDYFRGQDSTGVAVLRNDGKTVETLKVADDPIILMQHTNFETVLDATKSTIFLGHNRASTIGASTRANAHPFTHGTITGVHNGTLTKACKDALSVRVGEEFGTDSETVFAHINMYGIEDTVSRMVGAWALVFIDTADNTLNMIRNNERPLFICSKETSRGTVLQWASEYEMIASARMMTADTAPLAEDDEGFAYFPLPTDILHTWKMSDLLAKEGRPTCKAVKGAGGTPPKVTYTAPASVGFTANNNGSTYQSPPPAIITEPSITVTVIEDAEDPFNGLLTENQWDYIASYGCSYCGASVHPSDTGLTVFTVEQIVLCPNCSDSKVTTVNGTAVVPHRIHA